MKNLYKGINPHLNSMLQTPGTDSQPALWQTFHSAHVNHIADFLSRELPPNYIAMTEQSLQIWGADDGGIEFTENPRPDISIFQKYSRPSQQIESSAIRPTWQGSIAEVLEEDTFLTSVVIRDVREQTAPGKVVARLELLSPSNKPFHANYSAYRLRRHETLQGGIPLIEVDYLHEIRSPIQVLPAYPHHPDSYPYYIAVSDPRPEWEQGTVEVYGFNVGDPISAVPIPLAGDETLLFDFDPPYQYTFETRRWHLMIDYRQLPVRFETYSPADQARIRQQMEAIAAQS